MGKLTYNGIPWEDAKHLFKPPQICCCCGKTPPIELLETCDFCQCRVCFGCYHAASRKAGRRGVIKCNLCKAEEMSGMLLPRIG